ncbi:hypothetical protein ACS0TY_000809 [Phlomoides rotata]
MLQVKQEQIDPPFLGAISLLMSFDRRRFTVMGDYLTYAGEDDSLHKDDDSLHKDVQFQKIVVKIYMKLFGEKDGRVGIAMRSLAQCGPHSAEIMGFGECVDFGNPRLVGLWISTELGLADEVYVYRMLPKNEVW